MELFTIQDQQNLEYFETLDIEGLLVYIEALHCVKNCEIETDDIDPVKDLEAIQATIEILRDIILSKGGLH